MSCKSVHFMRQRASPKKLAGLVSKLNVDCTAGAEVLPHDGDFGASRLWTSAGGQTRDGGSLSSKAGSGRRGDKRRKREVREAARDTLSSESEDAGGTASFIAPIHVFPPTHGQNYSYSYCRARAGGVHRWWLKSRWDEELSRVPGRRLPPCVTHYRACVWAKRFKDCLKITGVHSCRQFASITETDGGNIRADSLSSGHTSAPTCPRTTWKQHNTRWKQLNASHNVIYTAPPVAKRSSACWEPQTLAWVGKHLAGKSEEHFNDALFFFRCPAMPGNCK